MTRHLTAGGLQKVGRGAGVRNRPDAISPPTGGAGVRPANLQLRRRTQPVLRPAAEVGTDRPQPQQAGFTPSPGLPPGITPPSVSAVRPGAPVPPTISPPQQGAPPTPTPGVIPSTAIRPPTGATPNPNAGGPFFGGATTPEQARENILAANPGIAFSRAMPPGGFPAQGGPTPQVNATSQVRPEIAQAGAPRLTEADLAARRAAKGAAPSTGLGRAEPEVGKAARLANSPEAQRRAAERGGAAPRTPSVGGGTTAPPRIPSVPSPGLPPGVTQPIGIPTQPPTGGGPPSIQPPAVPGGGGQPPIGGGGQPPIQPPAQPGDPNVPTLGGSGLVPQGTQAVGLEGLGGLIERQLANPSRFDDETFKQVFGFAKGELERDRDAALDAATADAQARGVFFGSPLTTSRGDIQSEFGRGLGALGSNLLLEQARTGGQDQQAAIANAFRFGENQLGADQFAAQLGLGTAGLGFEGAPDINQGINAIGNLPIAQPGGTSDLFGQVGNIAGLFGQPQQPQGGQPQIAPPGAVPPQQRLPGPPLNPTQVPSQLPAGGGINPVTGRIPQPSDFDFQNFDPRLLNRRTSRTA